MTFCAAIDRALVVWLAAAAGLACGDETRPEPREHPEAPRPVDAPPKSPRATDVIEPTGPRDPPPGFVDLRKTIVGLRLDIRYATPNNFTGAVLPGYAVAGAWLRTDAANALQKVQADVAAEGLGLLVYDAYRPVRATEAMVAWSRAADRTDLLDDGYVARRSNHNRGTTVDLTLVDFRGGEPLDMGTAWDTFSERSHTRDASGPALRNRLRLREVMQRHGFAPYDKEWWHFSHAATKDAPAIDVPYGPDEPDGS